MAEYIKRAAAVDAVSDAYYDTPDVNLSAEKFEAAINGIPAADVAPVVHGQWIGIDSSFWKPTHSSDIPVFRKTYRCSECGRRTAIAENYCPNCGAKMEKEEADELD